MVEKPRLKVGAPTVSVVPAVLARRLNVPLSEGNGPAAQPVVHGSGVVVQRQSASRIQGECARAQLASAAQDRKCLPHSRRPGFA